MKKIKEEAVALYINDNYSLSELAERFFPTPTNDAERQKFIKANVHPVFVGKVIKELCRQNIVLREMPVSAKEIITKHVDQGYGLSELIEIYDWSPIVVNSRNFIKNHVLKDKYESQSKKRRMRTANKVKSTMMERYGVPNIGMIKNGWTDLNKIEYERLSYVEDFIQYKKDVVYHTSKLVKAILKEKEPRYCGYTGIQFKDYETDKVNPNDPRKRSVDHRVPSIISYINGLSPEEASVEENLVFCLRWVNSVKGNTTEESFLPIALHLRKRLIDEGFEHN